MTPEQKQLLDTIVALETKVRKTAQKVAGLKIYDVNIVFNSELVKKKTLSTCLGLFTSIVQGYTKKQITDKETEKYIYHFSGFYTFAIQAFIDQHNTLSSKKRLSFIHNSTHIFTEILSKIPKKDTPHQFYLFFQKFLDVCIKEKNCAKTLSNELIKELIDALLQHMQSSEIPGESHQTNGHLPDKDAADVLTQFRLLNMILACGLYLSEHDDLFYAAEHLLYVKEHFGLLLDLIPDHKKTDPSFYSFVLGIPSTISAMRLDWNATLFHLLNDANVHQDYDAQTWKQLAQLLQHMFPRQPVDLPSPEETMAYLHFYARVIHTKEPLSSDALMSFPLEKVVAAVQIYITERFVQNGIQHTFLHVFLSRLPLFLEKYAALALDESTEVNVKGKMTLTFIRWLNAISTHLPTETPEALQPLLQKRKSETLCIQKLCHEIVEHNSKTNILGVECLYKGITGDALRFDFAPALQSLLQFHLNPPDDHAQAHYNEALTQFLDALLKEYVRDTTALHQVAKTNVNTISSLPQTPKLKTFESLCRLIDTDFSPVNPDLTNADATNKLAVLLQTQSENFIHAWETLPQLASQREHFKMFIEHIVENHLLKWITVFSNTFYKTGKFSAEHKAFATKHLIPCFKLLDEHHLLPFLRDIEEDYQDGRILQHKDVRLYFQTLVLLYHTDAYFPICDTTLGALCLRLIHSNATGDTTEYFKNIQDVLSQRIENKKKLSQTDGVDSEKLHNENAIIHICIGSLPLPGGIPFNTEQRIAIYVLKSKLDQHPRYISTISDDALQSTFLTMARLNRTYAKTVLSQPLYPKDFAYPTPTPKLEIENNVDLLSVAEITSAMHYVSNYDQQPLQSSNPGFATRVYAEEDDTCGILINYLSLAYANLNHQIFTEDPSFDADYAFTLLNMGLDLIEQDHFLQLPFFFLRTFGQFSGRFLECDAFTAQDDGEARRFLTFRLSQDIEEYYQRTRHAYQTEQSYDLLHRLICLAPINIKLVSIIGTLDKDQLCRIQQSTEDLTKINHAYKSFKTEKPATTDCLMPFDISFSYAGAYRLVQSFFTFVAGDYDIAKNYPMSQTVTNLLIKVQLLMMGGPHYKTTSMIDIDVLRQLNAIETFCKIVFTKDKLPENIGSFDIETFKTVMQKHFAATWTTVEARLPIYESRVEALNLSHKTQAIVREMKKFNKDRLTTLINAHEQPITTDVTTCSFINANLDLTPLEQAWDDIIKNGSKAHQATFAEFFLYLLKQHTTTSHPFFHQAIRMFSNIIEHDTDTQLVNTFFQLFWQTYQNFDGLLPSELKNKLIQACCDYTNRFQKTFQSDVAGAKSKALGQLALLCTLLKTSKTVAVGNLPAYDEAIDILAAQFKQLQSILDIEQQQSHEFTALISVIDAFFQQRADGLESVNNILLTMAEANRTHSLAHSSELTCSVPLPPSLPDDFLQAIQLFANPSSDFDPISISEINLAYKHFINSPQSALKHMTWSEGIHTNVNHPGCVIVNYVMIVMQYLITHEEPSNDDDEKIRFHAYQLSFLVIVQNMYAHDSNLQLPTMFHYYFSVLASQVLNYDIKDNTSPQTLLMASIPPYLDNLKNALASPNSQPYFLHRAIILLNVVLQLYDEHALPYQRILRDACLHLSKLAENIKLCEERISGFETSDAPSSINTQILPLNETAAAADDLKSMLRSRLISHAKSIDFIKKPALFTAMRDMLKLFDGDPAPHGQPQTWLYDMKILISHLHFFSGVVHSTTLTPEPEQPFVYAEFHTLVQRYLPATLQSVERLETIFSGKYNHQHQMRVQMVMEASLVVPPALKNHQEDIDTCARFCARLSLSKPSNPFTLDSFLALRTTAELWQSLKKYMRDNEVAHKLTFDGVVNVDTSSFLHFYPVFIFYTYQLMTTLGRNPNQKIHKKDLLLFLDAFTDSLHYYETGKLLFLAIANSTKVLASQFNDTEDRTHVFSLIRELYFIFGSHQSLLISKHAYRKVLQHEIHLTQLSLEKTADHQTWSTNIAAFFTSLAAYQENKETHMDQAERDEIEASINRTMTLINPTLEEIVTETPGASQANIFPKLMRTCQPNVLKRLQKTAGITAFSQIYPFFRFLYHSHTNILGNGNHPDSIPPIMTAISNFRKSGTNLRKLHPPLLALFHFTMFQARAYLSVNGTKENIARLKKIDAFYSQQFGTPLQSLKDIFEMPSGEKQEMFLLDQYRTPLWELEGVTVCDSNYDRFIILKQKYHAINKNILDANPHLMLIYITELYFRHKEAFVGQVAKIVHMLTAQHNLSNDSAKEDAFQKIFLFTQSIFHLTHVLEDVDPDTSSKLHDLYLQTQLYFTHLVNASKGKENILAPASILVGLSFFRSSPSTKDTAQPPRGYQLREADDEQAHDEIQEKEPGTYVQQQ